HSRFFLSCMRRHPRSTRDWSSDVCSSDLPGHSGEGAAPEPVLEVPPEAVEPSVDFIEPSERRGRLRQARLLCSCIRLGLALHDVIGGASCRKAAWSCVRSEK